MTPRKNASVPLLLIGLLLTGCGGAGPLPPRAMTEIREVRDVPPAALLTCKAEPPMPADSRDDAVNADWFYDAIAAADDCRKTLEELRQRFRQP